MSCVCKIQTSLSGSRSDVDHIAWHADKVHRVLVILLNVFLWQRRNTPGFGQKVVYPTLDNSEQVAKGYLKW